MLVLTRKLKEKILVMTPGGTPIWLKVLGVHGGKVKIGIDAPLNFSIDREEIAASKGHHHQDLGGEG